MILCLKHYGFPYLRLHEPVGGVSSGMLRIIPNATNINSVVFLNKTATYNKSGSAFTSPSQFILKNTFSGT